MGQIIGCAKSPLDKKKVGTRAERRNARKMGAELVESYKYKEGDPKRYLDDVQVQAQQTLTQETMVKPTLRSMIAKMPLLT